MNDGATGFSILKWAAKARGGLTTTTKLVLVALASYADAQGVCWPSMPRLAEDACLTERAVRKAVAELETTGYLTCERGSGRGNSSRYQLLLDRKTEAPGLDASAPERRNGVPLLDAKTRNEVPPLVLGRGNKAPPLYPEKGHHVPLFDAERRNDVPKKEERRSGERTNEHTIDSELRSSAVAPPPDARAELWKSGLAGICSLTGTSEGSARSFLGRLLKAASDDCARVSAVIVEAIDLRPADPQAWLMAAAKARKPGSANDPTGPQMPCPNDEPEAWFHLCAGTEVDRQGVRRPFVGGSYLDIAADLVADAAGIRSDWRGDWDTLAAWLRDGFDVHDAILPSIKRIAARPSYQPPTSLRYFDRAIRETRNASAPAA